MKDNKFVVDSTGTTADITANVDIAKVYGGYFSNNEAAQAFINIGIKPIMKSLDKHLTYCDFGGGKGFLSKQVHDHLTAKGFTCNSFVLDANEKFLASTQELGLQTILCNLNELVISEVDLITMRAVNHYNSLEKQTDLLKTAFASLRTGGYVISQVSSGSQENCSLRSKIANLKSLGRASSHEQYHWTAIEEYCELLRLAGFKNIAVAGNAPDCSWTPEEQWNRFHKETENPEQKQLFLTETYEIIKEYAEKHTPEYLGLSQNNAGETVINYQYPIIVCQK